MVVRNTPVEVFKLPIQYCEPALSLLCITWKFLISLLEKKSCNTSSAWLLLYELLLPGNVISTVLSKNLDTSEELPDWIALIISVNDRDKKEDNERKRNEESNKFFIAYHCVILFAKNVPS